MLAFTTWLETTWLHQWVVQNQLVFTAAETLHFMGLTVLCGSLLVIDLRGLGFFRQMPLIELHKLVPWALGAFVVQLLTGITFIASNPGHYFTDLSFQLKMALIPLAGLNALIFEVYVFRPMLAGVPGVETRAVTRITSGLSILIWALVLICGRLIPYV
jgi:hypothetical protein